LATFLNPQQLSSLKVKVTENHFTAPAGLGKPAKPYPEFLLFSSCRWPLGQGNWRLAGLLWGMI
jgi:hypothetical protein